MMKKLKRLHDADELLHFALCDKQFPFEHLITMSLQLSVKKIKQLSISS